MPVCHKRSKSGPSYTKNPLLRDQKVVTEATMVQKDVEANNIEQCFINISIVALHQDGRLSH